MRTRSVDGEKFNAFLRRACPGNIIKWFQPSIVSKSMIFQKILMILLYNEWVIDWPVWITINLTNERTDKFIFKWKTFPASNWFSPWNNYWIRLKTVHLIHCPCISMNARSGCLIVTNSSISLWPGRAAYHPPPLGSVLGGSELHASNNSCK